MNEQPLNVRKSIVEKSMMLHQWLSAQQTSQNKNRHRRYGNCQGKSKGTPAKLPADAAQQCNSATPAKRGITRKVQAHRQRQITVFQ